MRVYLVLHNAPRMISYQCRATPAAPSSPIAASPSPTLLSLRGGAEISWLKPGARGASENLQSFIDVRLKGFADQSNDPNKDVCSHMAAYFNMGQMSAQAAVLRVKRCRGNPEGIKSFVEQAVVRRELSDNLCFYNGASPQWALACPRPRPRSPPPPSPPGSRRRTPPCHPRVCPDNYDSLSGAAEWARSSLREHASDPREWLYSMEELEQGKTHEDLWNAAQLQLVSPGSLAGAGLRSGYRPIAFGEGVRGEVSEAGGGGAPGRAIDQARGGRADWASREPFATVTSRRGLCFDWSCRFATARCTTSSGCTGPRRSSSGPLPPRTPSKGEGNPFCAGHESPWTGGGGG